MADPTTQITSMEIIDTAVKIGLGALISGVFTYWVTKLNHLKDIEKQAIYRNRETIEKIAAEFEIFWNSYRNYFSLSYEYIAMLEKKEQIPSATTDKFCDAEKEVREKVENLSLAQSQLLLLGENKASNYLTEFARKTEYYLRETSKPKIPKTLKNIGENHNEVIEIRKLFYSEMSSIYKNLAFNKRLK